NNRVQDATAQRVLYHLIGVAAALHQALRSPLVARNTESPHIVEIAFASTFNDRHDMVGMPQGSGWIHSETRGFLSPFPAGQATKPAAQLFSINPAFGADAPVALEDFLSEVSRIRPEFVLMHAIYRAERAAAFWHLEPAPAA